MIEFSGSELTFEKGKIIRVIAGNKCNNMETPRA